MQTITIESPNPMTIQTFITIHNIGLSVTQTDRNPHMPDNANGYDHWRCLITRPGHRMTVIFSQGYGHSGAEPKLAEVLDCLAFDAASSENARTFAEWCSEYGYDTDSRQALRTFEAVRQYGDKLKTFLGKELYEELLWRVER